MDGCITRAMTERVTFESKRGDQAQGVTATPAGSGDAPAVVIIHEWWGINDQIKTVAEKWASEGFVAVVVDVFRGKTASDATEAGKLMQELDRARAIDDIAGAVAYAGIHPRSTGKVGVTGYCMGGALTFASAALVDNVAAAVPFYGVPSPAPDWSKVVAPIQAHFAAKDGWAKPELAKEIEQTLTRLGKSMELHVYDADHAFCNDRRPEVYNADAAKQSWQRAVAFMRQHLAN
jgi:carboxymethylenebutenolidase